MPDSVITEQIKNDMKATKPWVMLISILLFISIGIMLIAALGMLAMPMPGEAGAIPMAAKAVMAVMYIIMGLLYFFPAKYLYKYGSSIGTMLSNNNVGSLEVAISYQKSFWRFIGWLTLLSIIIGFLGIAAAILIPAFVAGM